MSKGQSHPQKKTFVLTTGQENIDPGNFTFRQRTLGLDWRKVAGIDADEIRESGNVELLQELIFTITFCNVDAEFAHSALVDKNLLKLFKTAQLIIEYLIHCQECLLTTVNRNSQELVSLREEVASLQEKLAAEKEISKKAKKECHKRRLLAAQYQADLLAVKTGDVPREQFPCPDCPKIFLSGYYLKVHRAKRHSAEIAQQMPQIQQMVVHQSAEMPPQQAGQQHPQEHVVLTVNPVVPTPVIDESRHKEEMEQLRTYFTRELTEMSEKMAEWQRLAEQLRNTQREVLTIQQTVTKPISPTPAPVLSQTEQTTPMKQSNFGAKLEDDVMEQEKRILDQLGHQLNGQFVSFAGQLDERVLQLSRGIADQLATDNRRHVDVLGEQLSTLMTQLAKEREAREIAERQRDEALVSKQTVTYIQPRTTVPKSQVKRSIFQKASAESQSSPSLAIPVPFAPVPIIQVPVHLPLPAPAQPAPLSETSKKTETKQKKSFFETLSSKFKSPKKSTSTPSLALQQQQQQVPPTVQEEQVAQAATLPRQAGQKTESRPDFYPSVTPALPKVVYQDAPSQKRPSDQLLAALMADSVNKSSDSELTSRPSSSSPQHPIGQSPPKTRDWQSVEAVPVEKTEPAAAAKMAQPPPTLPNTTLDTLQASMTLPTMSATGNLGSTGPGEPAASSMYVNAASTTAASGLVLQPRSAEDDSITATATDLDLAIRRQMKEQLEKELAKRGISKGERGLTAEKFAALRAQLEDERRKREFTHPDFFSNTRAQILSTIDKMAVERGGSTYRSEMSKTETTYHTPKQQLQAPSNVAARAAMPVISANATPRADRSEIMQTESQWTSEEDASDIKPPMMQQPSSRQQQNMTIPVVPAHVAAASSTAGRVVSSGASPPNAPVPRKSERPVHQFSNSPIARGQQQANVAPQVRTDAANSLSGTTDDVSTMDITSSIQDQPIGRGAVASTNDFDEDSDDALITKEMARYNIDTSAPTSASPQKNKQITYSGQPQPTFGRSGQGMGSRPESSLTGISDDYDQDLGP